MNDRIDTTLYYLSLWYRDYQNRQSNKFYSSFNNSKDWLEKFEDFEAFIKFYLLDDFVNDKYEVYDLSKEGDLYNPSISENKKRIDIVEAYIDGNINAIKKRNEKMKEELTNRENGK